MRRSIATVSLGGKLTEKLDAIAAAHFDGVEIFQPDLESWGGTAAEIGRQASDLGLTIDLFQPFRDFEGVSDEALAPNLKRADIVFDIMGDLGAPMLLVCSNTGADAVDDDERAASHLHALAERASRRGLKIGYEALAWGRHVNRFDHALRIVEKADHPNLGLILDSFHTLIRPDDWSTLGDVPGNQVSFVQLGDAPRMDLDPLSIRRNHSRLPGDGDLDIRGFLRTVLDTGYRGTISVEIFNERTPETPFATAHAAMRSLLQMEERAGRAIA